MAKLLGIDIGTTNSKAGLFDEDGKMIAVASRPTVAHRSEEGYSYYDPEQMWETLASAICEVMEHASPEEVGAVGIASMAESGLLVDRKSGSPRSVFMPWFDTVSAPQAERMAKAGDAYELFRRTGLRGSFKLGLAKLLWIQDRDPDALRDSVWLSASGYIAYRLTGAMASDYSLAARTYAFRIDRKEWDAEWLSQFGLSPALFPDALPGGEIVGRTADSVSGMTGLAAGTPVAIAGHDHVAAALAVGAIAPGVVYDSMGTAETLVGTFQERPLGKAEFASGMSYGCHIASGRYFWMGGNSSSGGSIEWLRGLLADDALSYESLFALLSETESGPSGILFYPYLTGSGAPAPDSRVKAAYIGLTKSHGKADLIKAALEGTAYQLESIRRSAEEIAGESIDKMAVVGGGTRLPLWLQIKADILGCSLELPPVSEATLLGAAMAAGIGSGIYAGAEEAVQATSRSRQQSRLVTPDSARHAAYRKWYEEGYMALQEPMRHFYQSPLFR
jgi:sugar (pentulose or hexulose) kinase